MHCILALNLTDQQHSTMGMEPLSMTHQEKITLQQLIALGPKLVHDFMAMTFSVKLAVLCKIFGHSNPIDFPQIQCHTYEGFRTSLNMFLYKHCCLLCSTIQCILISK